MEPDVADPVFIKTQINRTKGEIPSAAYPTESGNGKYFLPFTYKAYEVYSGAHRRHASIFSDSKRHPVRHKRSTWQF
jgi:hypothetical protein